MKTRPIVYAAIALSALVLAVPLRAGAMGGGSCSTPTLTLTVTPPSLAPGAVGTVSCTASATTPAVETMTLTVGDGTLDPSGATVVLSQPISGASGQATWTAPVTEGTVTVTCASDAVPAATFGGACTNAGSTSQTVTVAAVPVVLAPAVGAISGPSALLESGSARFTVGASDQNDPAQALSYAWSASGGTITQDPLDPAAATWQAPATGGYDITVTVSNASLSTTSTKTVAVVLARYQASLPVPLSAPRRLCAAQDGYGGLYVVDGRQPLPLGEVKYLNARGEVRGAVPLPEPALAVAQGAGYLWVTTASGNVLKVDSASGRIAGSLALAGGVLLKPLGVAYEPTRMVLWIAEWDGSRIRGVRPDGATVAMLSAAGGVAMSAPVDVAVDPAGGRVWVLTGEPNTAGNFLHAFDLDGNFVGSYLTRDSLSRGGGLAVGAGGRVYVADGYQGVVLVLDRSGGVVGTIGVFGESPGELIAPAGMALMVNGDLAVATPTNGRVERYGTGTSLPATCTAFGQLDSDCDGLPDAWERAHGLKPLFAGDALAAFGSTGFSNYEVASYQATYGTDPWAPPTVVVTAPSSTPPGLVKMFAAASGEAVACQWRQVSGPAAVALSGATTISPTFIARKAGVYGFEVVGSTPYAAAAPTPVSVEVTNVPPVVDAGRVVVTTPGHPIRLDGRLSSDANGDALTFSWDQTLGPAVTAGVDRAPLVVKARRPGLYKFMLTATDANGAASSTEVPVVVSERSVSTAIPTATPSPAQVGLTVSLDGTASLFADVFPTFSWEQIAGPPAVLTDASQPVATFVPSVAGRYSFALSVGGSGGASSPPARVDVYVTDAGQALPEIQSASTADPVVAVSTAVALTASGTGSGYAWRQAAGPAAGLTDADRGTATVVPFTPGFYAFEVVAKDGAAVGLPARVTFEARAGGKPIPVARASSPGLAPVVGQLVFLDGRGSTGAANYRWTQVAGPWVALNGQGGVVSFTPRDAATYAFELEVDDGAVRSAPVHVEVNVSEQGVH